MEGGLVSSSRYLQSHGLVSVLVWSLYISSYATVSAQGSLITCNADTVKLNVSTSLTCTFPEEVASTKRDFTIYRYLEKGNPDAVLDCWWLSGNVDCFVAPGYQYNKQISSNTVRLDIPRVSAPQIAVYACQLASYGPDSIKTCELSVQLGGKSACEIPSVKPKSQAALTCYFPGDLSKTRTGFTVSHHSSQGAETTVIKCTWQGESLTCDTVSGYVFDKKVISHTSASHLTIRINQALENHEGTYRCHAEGSTYEDCSFMLEKEKTSTCNHLNVTENEPATFACSFSVNVNVTRKDIKVIRQGNTSTEVLSCTWVSEKLSCTTAPGFEFHNTVTDRLTIKVPRATHQHNGTYVCHLQGSQFENFQSCDFIVMTEYETKAYVVPSMYFNNNTYEVKTFAEEDVYVTKPPDGQTVKHDMAMGRVLTSFHHLAKHGNEVMFVISQFDYDKYLANPRKEFTDHKLPRPGKLKKSDNRYGDFDILIIHRKHGLVVGVVKTCSGGSPNKEVEEEDNLKKVVEELKQGCTQLDEAEKLLQHLLSDLISHQSKPMQVRKLLVLPNLSEELLGNILNENQGVAQILKECLRFPENNVFNECLCGDHMRGSNRTRKIKDWFNTRFSESRDKTLASDEEYPAIVTRFCGPATIWSLNVPDHQSGILPKTLEDSVWMTVGFSPRTEGQPKLCSKDILILCENDEETALCDMLKKSGISVEMVDENNREKVFKANKNEVWVGKGENMFGIKRKVVVFVEGNAQKGKDKHKMPVDLKRLRSLTSSTSQLIWLKGL
ncbi:hypothetical protein C0Q70_17619 [Pomacea canaliculata]|uniref:Ig-like domain-containing protein n=1 Tax=Pomacea canaliculata TaxID=400727 RepID=A0A2T7NKW4_POMCA|nr:hypothetical protein C0Q70_17619 [Pomacea canaliculata]